MTNSHALLLCTALFALTACGSRGIEISSRPIEIEVGRTADPAQVIMLPVNLRVITKENVESYMKELANTQGNVPVFLAMTAKDYENMALNLADLRRYIEQQQAIINYYRRITEKSTILPPRN